MAACRVRVAISARRPAACCERLPWLRAADGLGQWGRIARRRQLGQLIGSFRQALSAVGDFASRLGQLFFQSFLAVAQVLNLDLLPPRQFQLAGIGQSQLRPQLVEQRRGLLFQVFVLGGQAGQIGLGLAVNTQLFVDGFDLRRARNQPLRHGQGRNLPVEPGDFRRGVELGLTGSFQTRDRIAAVLDKVGRQYGHVAQLGQFLVARPEPSNGRQGPGKPL